MSPDSEPSEPSKPPESEGKEPPKPSFGEMSEHHWSRARQDKNQEALEYYREKSRAPGVAEGGSHRNQYCLACGGVVPLEYDSREPLGKDRVPERCPHCGAELEGRVRQMFNWVETDQVPEGDARAVLPMLALVSLVLLVAAVLLVRALAG
jgi:hypothetical protein